MTCNDTTSVLRLVEDEEAFVDEDGVSLCFFFPLRGGIKELGKREEMKGWELGSPLFISHKFRPFGRGPTTRPFGDLRSS